MKTIPMCESGLNLISPYHPILFNSEWFFAKDKLPMRETFIDYLYNLELDSAISTSNTIFIGDQVCCTLGWGDNNNRLYRNDKEGKLYILVSN